MAHVSVSETTLAPPVPAPVPASVTMMTSVGRTPAGQCVVAEETVSVESVSVRTMIRVGANTGENIVSVPSGCVQRLEEKKSP